MTLTPNKQQRPGRSYLHGVVRDANRPYLHRAGMQRLLHGGYAAGLRPLYGNSFMPVSFKYLHPMFYGEDHEAAMSFHTLAPVRPHALRLPELQVPGASFEPCVAGNDIGSIQSVSGFMAPESKNLHGELKKTENEHMVQTAEPVHIRIPDTDNAAKKSAPSPYNAAKKTTAGPSTPSVQLPEKQLSAGMGFKAHGPKPSTPGTSRANAVPASLGQERKSARFSLTPLAQKLEQSNFGKDTPKEKEFDAPVYAADSVEAFKKADRSMSRQVPEKTTQAEVKQAPAVAPARPRLRLGVQSSRLTAVTRDEVERNDDTNITPKADVPLVEPRIKAAMVRSQALQPIQHPHYQEAFGQYKRRCARAAASEDEPEPAAGRVHKRPNRRPNKKPVIIKKVRVFRGSATKAFWERSYLPRMEVRLYR